MAVYLGGNKVSLHGLMGQIIINSLLPVRFIDYDGTVLHTYSINDFLALESMPSNPEHKGLISQGWNWSLEDAKAQLTAYPEAGLVIGQTYITDDGKTRLYVHFEEGRLHPYLGICPNGTVVIDWGDNSATSTLTGTSLTVVQHTDHEYASAGDYIITLTASSGSFAFYGVSGTAHILKKDTSTTANIHRVYTNCLQKVEIGTSAGIGNYAFRYCSSLASITIPDGITSIGNYAFCVCSSLANITIPDGVTSIGNYTFSNCHSLTSVMIPNTVTNIGNYAFNYCSSLTNIVIPDTVTSIQTYAFNYCSSLTNIAIPNGVTSIGTYMFNYCSSLTNIIIPDTVTSIGSSAFYYCSSLANITIPNGITNIGNLAFSNCSSLASIAIPDTVTSIGNSVFSYCPSLINIIIPDTLTSIGPNAFSSCLSLVSITIPDGVTTIENYAISNCYSLTSITIPDTVTTIGNNAFSGCYGMAEYHFLSTTPPTLGTTAFNNIQSDCVIYVPKGSLSAYQAATNWSDYASYMQEEPTT